MLFRPTRSASLVAEVRKFFGLQQQLADYIGVSRELLARQADAADELDALQSAQRHLLRVRAEALEAALAALLPPVVK
ncbi:hypothetical protein [Hymenobacter lucidus]|uniref:Uncharacterized protein n=1 Tax=Hymenobacter lucidus TaxID=2880930 RepID=A0ABS8AWF2_9BACT|nr:hypothetical protein [Hymenobacter lucidus]MCB2410136.1 hypothetical protein [Hymenobacter lucidus]